MKLVGILGRRSFSVFFIVTLLVVAVLAAVNIASRFALKAFVEDQLARTAWDISAYQSGDVAATSEVSSALGNTDGIVRANELLFLRNSLTTEDVAYVDGEPIRLPWLSLLTTADASILPASIRPSGNRAVFVLVGTKAQMGNAYADLQGKRHFEIRIEDHHHEDNHGHGGTSHDNVTSIAVFDIALERTIRIERNDLNRWFLEQASSPALIPEVGAILVTPFDKKIITAFDALARGIVTVHHDDGDIHEEAGNYFPDIIHLLKVDTNRLITGWDVDGSLEQLADLQARLETNTFAIGPRVFIDNSTKVLLERMQATAEHVGLISILIAIPLLWVSWILMGNLSGMLWLNERRKFGLMRLRGASGRAMGRALMLAIAAGSVAGGLLGAVVGTLLPIWIYEGGPLPLATVLLVQPPQMILVFVAIGALIALVVSRRFIRSAAKISPLEASGRIIRLETEGQGAVFGWAGLMALLLGGYKIIGWSLDFSVVSLTDSVVIGRTDRILDFVGFPLFIYGLVTLLASRRRLMDRLLMVVVGFMGGPLRHAIAQHISTRPKRIASFLLVTAMMATIGIYPTVISAIFDDKIARGTSIQVGTDIQITFSAAEIASNELLADGGIRRQYQALSEKVPEIAETIRTVDGVASATWTIVEGVSDGVYIPGYGFNGLPLYFVPDPPAYLDAVTHEPTLAQGGNFFELVSRIPRGQVLMSPAVAAFTQKAAGARTQLGMAIDGSGMLEAHVGGTIWYLPGSPLVSVTDRESFDTARVDYVNHLFSNDAYLVADPNVGSFGELDVLINSVQIGVNVAPGYTTDEVVADLLDTLPIEPSSIRKYDDELRRVGSDMYVFLARRNVDIYLTGGLLLAVIGILSIAYSNYLEDRRTLALLRIRGAGPGSALRFIGAGVFAPTAIGLMLGIGTALVVGYGMTNLVWDLREIRNILSYLSTHLVVSGQTLRVVLLLVAVIAVIGYTVSRWAFRRTVREGLSEI